VVLTAVMCTSVDCSLDVTLGGVDSEFTSLPLVLVRGPVKLRDVLFTWWQVKIVAFTCLNICLFVSVIYRVRTDPGKVWNVLEFNVEIFKALKSLENDHRYEKVWKNP